MLFEAAWCLSELQLSKRQTRCQPSRLTTIVRLHPSLGLLIRMQRSVICSTTNWALSQPLNLYHVLAALFISTSPALRGPWRPGFKVSPRRKWDICSRHYSAWVRRHKSKILLIRPTASRWYTLLPPPPSSSLYSSSSVSLAQTPHARERKKKVSGCAGRQRCQQP